jgi:ABC-type nitrate/sulfonate/bicarbonate transport system substrate-binding protein
VAIRLITLKTVLSTMVSRRILVASALVVVAALSLGSSAFFLLENQHEAPVTVTRYIGGLASNEAAMEAAGVEGFYAQNGISVTSVVLSGTAASVQALAADRTGMAFVWGNLLEMIALMANNPNSTQLISVASTGHLNPFAFIYLKSSGISAPSDLIGKVIAVGPGTTASRMLSVFLKRNGLDTKVHVENIALSGQGPALLAKKVDAIFRFADAIASITATAKEINEEVGYMFLSQYGMPPPGYGIIVQKSLVANRPDIVRAIVNATMNGIRFCILETARCAADFVKVYPTFEVNKVLGDNRLLINVLYGPPFNDTDAVRKLSALQLGWHDPPEIARIVQLAEDIFGFAKIDVNTLYTNQFVEPSS